MSTDNKTDEKTYVVYCHTCSDGVYYGVTKNVKRRWIPSLYKKTSLAPYIEKYGWDAINHQVLFENLTYNEALKREDELICNARENGTALNVRRSGHYKQEDKVAYDKAYYEANKDKLNARSRERYKNKKK